MRNVWRRMRNRLSQAVVSTCTTLVPTSRPFVCAASHRSSRHRLCDSLQQLRTRPTRPPFFRGHPVSGAFTRQITTDFRTLAREPPLCANACVTWLQGLPCTLVPRTFLFPFVVTTNSRTCPIRRARKSSSLVSLFATLSRRAPQLRPKTLPSRNAHAICAHCAALRLSSNGACPSRPWTCSPCCYHAPLASSITRLAIKSAMLLIYACPPERFSFRSPSMVSPKRVHGRCKRVTR